MAALQLLGVLLTLCASAYAVPTVIPPSIDLSKDYVLIDELTSRISVGYYATKGQFPSIAAIKLPQGLCGGILISKTAVLTAAHCVNGYTNAALTSGTTVYVGALANPKSNAAACTAANNCEVHSVTKVYIHPDYNPAAYLDKTGKTPIVGDMAIIILSKASAVTPVKLASADPATGSKLRVAGWGLAAGTITSASKLRYVDLQIASDNECYTTTQNYAGGSSICGNSFGTWAQSFTASACMGDSGGPLIDPASSILYGSVAFGVLEKDGDTCGKYLKSVFMSVAHHSTWIYSIIGRPPCVFNGQYRFESVACPGKHLSSPTQCNDTRVLLRTIASAPGIRTKWAIAAKANTLTAIKSLRVCPKNTLTSPGTTAKSQPALGDATGRFKVVPASSNSCSIVKLEAKAHGATPYLSVASTCDKFFWSASAKGKAKQFKLVKV